MSTRDLGRQLCRLGAAYIIDTARQMAEALDTGFTNVLILLAIVRANVAPIAALEDSAEEATAWFVPTDDQRRPVTVYALAREVSLPYETVRRHVRELRARGLCQAVEGGVIVPARVLGGRTSQAEAAETVERLQKLVDKVARFGIAIPVKPTAKGTLQRLARLSTAYLLDGVRLMAEPLDLDAQSALVLHTAGQINTAHIREDVERATTHGGLDAVPPDQDRTPASVYAIARRLKLPYETTRRTCARLVELGLMTRTETGGMVVPSAVFARPDVVEGFGRFADATRIFLEKAVACGIIPSGSRQRAPAAQGTAGAGQAYSNAGA